MAPASDIHIEATETDPAVQAQTAVRAMHQRLRADLAELVTAGGGTDDALKEFGTGRLRRHLAAADGTLHAAAAGAAGTRLLVRALRTSAAAVDARIDALSAAEGGAATAEAARAVDAVLAAHLAVEETVLLPALADLPGADLPTLVADLRTLLDGGTVEAPEVIDVREIPHGRRHPRIFACFARLAPGEAFTLVNNHDPKPLRREFEATHPGAHTWDYLESGPEVWRVRIGKAAAAAGVRPVAVAAPAPIDTEQPTAPPVPLFLCDVQALAARQPAPAGALWKLAESGRQLDANLVHLPGGERVETHAEPDLDVLLLVVAGDGALEKTDGTIQLAGGALCFLPHGSTRRLLAGADGLTYLTVHRRRMGMQIRPRQS